MMKGRSGFLGSQIYISPLFTGECLGQGSRASSLMDLYAFN